jgi:hypothetical protein
MRSIGIMYCPLSELTGERNGIFVLSPILFMVPPLIVEEYHLMKKRALMLCLAALGFLAAPTARAANAANAPAGAASAPTNGANTPFSLPTGSGAQAGDAKNDVYKFTADDWKPLAGLEQDSLGLEQEIDQFGSTKVSSKDLQQLMCLNNIDSPLSHIQGVLTREKELLQLATQMSQPDDEKKIETQQLADISPDLLFLKGYKEQTALAVKMCAKNNAVLSYAQRVNDIDDRAVSALASIQARIVQH